MKKFFLTAAFGVAIMSLLIACDGEKAIFLDNSDEFVEMQFAPNGIDVNITPLLKASSSDDLFGLQLIEEGSYYACCLTDNLAFESIRVRKGKYYACALIYVPNGKNILAREGDVFGPPFIPFNRDKAGAPALGAGVYYSNTTNIGFASYGAAQKVGKKSSKTQTNAWNDVDIYYGSTSFHARSDSAISIDLYRMMFGIQVNVANFREGNIYVYSGESGNKSWSDVLDNDGNGYNLTPDAPYLDAVQELFYMPFAVSENVLLNWNNGERIRIDYVDNAGNVTGLVNKVYYVERMKKYVFNIDLDEVLLNANGSFQGTVIDEDWTTSDAADAENQGKPWYLN
ncbi:MAG: hypothetical protein ACOX32_05455 [Bacteroidaceae bacterium]|jgi:hypothetical protein|nr:hypothetical protein [Bacteroidaceae bacterium]